MIIADFRLCLALSSFDRGGYGGLRAFTRVSPQDALFLLAHAPHWLLYIKSPTTRDELMGKTPTQSSKSNSAEQTILSHLSVSTGPTSVVDIAILIIFSRRLESRVSSYHHNLA